MLLHIFTTFEKCMQLCECHSDEDREMFDPPNIAYSLLNIIRSFGQLSLKVSSGSCSWLLYNTR